MSFKPAFIFWLMLLFTVKSVAQIENDQILEQIIESVMENAGEDFDFTDLTARLNDYQRHPLNLNKASSEQLQELMFLSPLQISQLIYHRQENGNFLELYELQSIESFDTETIRKLTPFVTLGEQYPLPKLTLRNVISESENDLIITFGSIIQKQQGYVKPDDENKSYYTGTPQRFLTRYRYHFGGSLSVALTMEKDPGEAFSAQSKRFGFDFYSGNISYKNEGTIKKLILGDYSLQFGQGLTLWSGLSFGKGAAIASVAKNEIGLKPYTSTNETLFLRGFASTIDLAKRTEFTPFVSYRAIDAGLDSSDRGTSVRISSLSQTGLHRTSNEIENRNSINQLVYGANVQYKGKVFQVGAIAYQTTFSKGFQPGDEPGNSKDFAGSKLVNAGVYYSYNWRNLYFFGEAGHSLNSGYAFLTGAIASLTPSLTLVAFHRNYQADYHSFFNQALAEGTNAVNEKGFYSGLIFSPGRRYEFTAYADFFRFPWLRFRVDAPSSGYELFSQFVCSPSKALSISCRYKLECKQQNDDLENTINYLEDIVKRSYRLEINSKINHYFRLRSRAEVVTWRKDKYRESGFLLYQDLFYSPMRSRWSGNFRIAIFDTKGFNSRIYAYENDVLYGFSAPAYQNKGLRFYVNSRFRMRRNLDAWLRYAVSSYSNLSEIGSGLDKIKGNNKSDIKLQFRFQF